MSRPIPMVPFTVIDRNRDMLDYGRRLAVATVVAQQNLSDAITVLVTALHEVIQDFHDPAERATELESACRALEGGRVGRMPT
jgi:hypothetical protein